MRKLWLLVILCVVLGIPALAAEAFEDYQPLSAGMTLTFHRIVEHIEKKDVAWTIHIEKESFPESLTYTWKQPQSEGVYSGTRILTDLKYSRNFNVWYKNGESKATNDTAPWLSTQVLTELREKGTSSNFREAGKGAINWVSVDLEVKDKVLFPVIINGKAEALHALQLSKGIIVWNNLKNPLVLQYEPLGIPLFTSMTGWKVIKIDNQ